MTVIPVDRSRLDPHHNWARHPGDRWKSAISRHFLHISRFHANILLNTVLADHGDTDNHASEPQGAAHMPI